MEAMHTPGPWIVRRDGPADDLGEIPAYVGEVPRLAATGRHICQISGWGQSFDADAQQQANARLIAAAPDLLAALRELADAHAALLAEHGKPWGWGLLPVRTARDAIARAEGRGA